MPIKLAVLVSGRGSNLKAILEAIDEGRLDASVAVVLSNKAGVGALSIAKEHSVEAVVVENQGLSRTEHEEKVLSVLNSYAADYLVLAGYMRVLSPNFLRNFRDPKLGLYRVINIHPSLLPAFPGANAYQDCFDAGLTESGITVHLVDEQVDHGPILAQKKFPRLQDDSLETFKQRGLAVEHQIFPEVLQKLATQGLSQLAKESVKQ